MTLEIKKTRLPAAYNLAICVLASGSKGNATYISDGETSILIDGGLSGVEIKRRLTSRSLTPEELDAIIVTHEHTDHIQGVGILSRRYNLPVYINRKTHQEKRLIRLLGFGVHYKDEKSNETTIQLAIDI